ncbi:MAG: hypothetical protein EBQ97_00340 [Bacteroidetes bacterium]|nr:hypothetical protein [Bacteroidota bacterium]
MTGYQSKKAAALDEEGMYLVHHTQPAQELVRLRRGDILRCSESNELCTVWSTSTTGKTLVKWGANDFGEYTAEQIGENFWLEPQPQRPWVELTDEEREEIALEVPMDAVCITEAKLKEKNT